MNREVIQSLIDFYGKEENHEKLYMHSWLSNGFYLTNSVGHPVGEIFAACGTTGCLLGTAIALHKPDCVFVRNDYVAEFSCGNSFEVGEELFGLNKDQLDILFYVDEWCEHYSMFYEDEPVAAVLEILNRILSGEDVLHFLAG